MKKTYYMSALVALIVSAASFGAFTLLQEENKSIKIKHINATPSSSAVYTLDENEKLIPLDFTKTAEKVIDAVVHIKATQLSNYDQVQSYRAPQMPDLFRDFFGPDFRFEGQPRVPQKPQPRVGSGSGVIVGSEGYIMTNNHVIQNAQDIEVSLHDNRTFKAVLIGTDPTTDLALLQIKAKNLRTLPFVDSDKIKVGEWVLAAGNPFSLNSTITAGIVSAKGRNINILREKYAVEDFIQTDAAINPGNSGGALVNLDGGLVGINTAIASPTGSYSGYGFAVPSNIVAKVMEDLMKFGVVQRGVLGIMIRDLDGNLAKEKNIDLVSGVYVDSIMSESAAGDAGIQVGDVIVKINDNSIKSSPELQGMIARYRPGEKVNVVVNRKGKEKEFKVTLKDSKGRINIIAKEDVEILRILGAEFQDISGEEASRLGIAGGVKVSKLYPGKLVRETQMREGFVITKVDGKAIKSKNQLVNILEGKKGGVMLEGTYEDLPGKHYYAFGLKS